MASLNLGHVRGADGKDGKDGVIARNLLDNSDFGNPINHRGASSYSGSVYGIDRWRQWSAASSLTINDGYISFDGTNLVQYLERYDPDQVYTAAVCDVNGTIHTLTGNPSDATDNSYMSFGVGSNGFASVSIAPGSYIWAALYEGEYTADTLPPYVPKGYAAELAECKRYYNIIPYDMDDYYVNNSTSYPSIYPVSFPEMRIIPTVTLKESWNAGSAGVSVGFRTKSSLGFQAAATSGTRVAWHGKIELNADM